MSGRRRELIRTAKLAFPQTELGRLYVLPFGAEQVLPSFGFIHLTEGINPILFGRQSRSGRHGLLSTPVTGEEPLPLHIAPGRFSLPLPHFSALLAIITIPEFPSSSCSAGDGGYRSRPRAGMPHKPPSLGSIKPAS